MPRWNPLGELFEELAVSSAELNLRALELVVDLEANTMTAGDNLENNDKNQYLKQFYLFLGRFATDLTRFFWARDWLFG